VTDAKERRIVWALLALTGVVYLAFNAAFLPRLTNVNFGDVEFTGWSGAMGARVLRGERPFIDFVLPIPPGSFVLLAGLQWLVGKFMLLEELWLDAILQLMMALLGYFIARRFTTRKTALLTALATLITLIELNKECAYDHTAELVAWASIAAGTAALFPRGRARSDRAWLLCGALAGFTFAFKQSTGLGIAVGWAAGLAYLVLAELGSGRRAEASAYRLPAIRYFQGLAIGGAGVWFVLVAVGSTLRAFFQATFLDASGLKGGPGLLAQNLIAYLFADPAYPASLGTVLAVVLVGFAMVKRRGTIHLGDEPKRAEPIATWEIVTIGVATVATFAGGAVRLMKGPPGYSPIYIPLFDTFKQIPLFGPALVALFFVVHLIAIPKSDGDDAPSVDAARAGHALNAVFIAAFACTLLHNTSAPEFRPTYDNNPIVALGFAVIFVVLDRARLRWLSALLLVLVFGSLFGNKYFRAMTATTKVTSSSYLAGMRVNDRGLEVVRAAAHVRSLAGPNDTVLVLPEDLEIESIIGRPRPPLTGAIVFVDQYTRRVVVADMARLDEHLPKVIVIHPRRASEWQRFFRIWSGSSGAERMIWHVLDDVLPAHYRRESSYATSFLWQPGVLDVWVRRDPGDSAAPEEDTAGVRQDVGDTETASGTR